MAHLVYTDDPDAHVDWSVTDSNGNNLDWTSPVAALADGDYVVDAEWLGAAAPTRWLRIPLTGVAARSAGYNVYLKVPGGSDIHLGVVYVRDRT